MKEKVQIHYCRCDPDHQEHCIKGCEHFCQRLKNHLALIAKYPFNSKIKNEDWKIAEVVKPNP